MELDSRQTIIVAVLVLFLGKYLNGKVNILRKYNIPEAVTGGLVASLLFGLIYFIFSVDIVFSKHYRDILLIVFFSAIGLSTRIKSIIKGGRVLLVLTLFAVVFLFVQNYLGILLSDFFNVSKGNGLMAASVSLQGGHGNVVSWSPVIQEKFNITNTMEIGMISATLGLIIGGIFGGPTANFLIKRYKLKPKVVDSEQNITIGAKHGVNLKIDYNSILTVLLALAVSIGIGIYLHKFLELINFTLPLFATCMFGGVLIVNIIPLIIPKLNFSEKSPTLAITSDLSLGLFLAMAMMSLKFWEIGDEAFYIIVNILVQTIAIILFTIFILFRVLGKNYDAAVISAGYIGSAMGATPTAMANVAAVTKKNGQSEIALAVIPIMGAFIIQVSNALVINIFLIFT